MARLGSKKSRNGCTRCKERRVKCDEQRPCANCTKHDVLCSLLYAQAGRSESNNGDASTTPDESPASGLLPTASSPSGLYLPPDVGGWLNDLELMHHYTAHAYSTMPGNFQAQQTWGFVVPQQAFRYKFLMHCILAFSASHLAYIEPRSRPQHRLLASSHQSAAINELNRALAAVTPENCHAMFAAASLITLNAFAESVTRDVNALVDIFNLLRGMNVILSGSEALVHGGPFAAIIRQVQNQPRPLPPFISSLVIELQTAIIEIGPQSPMACTAATQLLESLQSGIDHSTHPAVRAVMYWPIKLEREYLESLRDPKDHYVKKIMEQYLRILHLAGSEFWFLSSWRDVTI